MIAVAMPLAAPLPLTPKQLAVLQIIVEWGDTYGTSPTYLELAEELDAPGRGQIHRYVSQLCSKGWLERTPSRARCLRVLHRPPMPDFGDIEFVMSERSLPSHLVEAVMTAGARFDRPEPAAC